MSSYEEFARRENPVEEYVPYVAKITGMGVNARGEYLACDLPNGREVELSLSGSSLDGWVISQRLAAVDGVTIVDSWAEFGVDDDGNHYIELLHTSEEFDWLPVHAYVRRIMPRGDYDLWKQIHRVSVDLSPHVALYYGEL